MVEISPEMVRIIVDLVLMLGSGIVGSYLTYVYAIKGALRERLLAERVALYRPLVHSLSSLIEEFSPERAKEKQSELNRLSRELLLYAPDNVYKAFIKAMASVKKGAKPKQMVEFMIALRKELMGKTEITADDVVTIELRP